MPKPRVFCIPGLGLSSQFLENLKLEYGIVTCLDWIEPNAWESIPDYAGRMSEPLNDVEGDVVLIGHSFGGIIAQEIAILRPVKQLILISTMLNPQEAPHRLKLLGKHRLHRLISKELILSTFPFWARTHSYRSPELRALFRKSVQRLSSHYFRWSLYQIATWPGTWGSDAHIIRLHGTRDVTFRSKKIDHVDHWIVKGDHNMIYLKGEEVSKIINQYLSDL